MLKERSTNQQNKFETIKIFAKSMKLSAIVNDHNFIYFGNKMQQIYVKYTLHPWEKHVLEIKSINAPNISR